MPEAFSDLELVDTDGEGSPRLGRTLKLNEIIELLQSVRFVRVTLKDADSNDVTLRLLALDDSAGTLSGGSGGGTVKTIAICENGSSTNIDFLIQP